MSLVSKIPPMVSAIAFGYGVGMAAPEDAVSRVQAAVAQQAPEMRPPPGYVLVPASSVAIDRSATNAWLAGGTESRELGRLRELTRDPHAAACDLDRPTYSHRRLESRRDRLVDDVDDLDLAGSEALSRLQLPDLGGSITKRTLKYVRFFTRTDRGRGMFETWLRRSGRYQDMIQQELRERRLPEDLIWVAMIESGFDPRARSPAGAVGLWQFMPATGEVYGLVQNRHVDQRKNPRLATQAAAHHLRDLYARFGNWDLALAAYNMGYEQLLDAIDRYGTTDFNELARQEAIPAETAAYVPKIMAAAIVANNLERFGFDRVEVQRPIDAAEIAVPPGTPLRTIAKAAGVSTAQVRTLNPDLLGDRVPPGRGDFLVSIPADTVARARAALPALLDHEPIVVEDVLDPVDLAGRRELVRPKLRDDESLLSLLPSPKKRKSLRDPLADLASRLTDDLDDDFEPEHRVRRDRRETVLYKVAPGDSLLSLARQYAIDIEDLARMNGLDPSDKLKEGSMIRLRVRRDALEGVREAERESAASRAKEAAPSEKEPARRAPAVEPDTRDRKKTKKAG